MSNIIDKIQVSGVTYDLVGGGGGNPTVELTQAQYDALVTAGTVQADTYYIITDAQGGDLSNYYTKTETNTLLGGKADTATTYTKTEVDNAITAATSTKQDQLVSGTNIKTINNESILGSGNIDIQGGGGKAIEAGRGISITTGETADTVSFNLPISAGTGTGSIIMGLENNVASGTRSFAGGGFNSITKVSATKDYAFAYGTGVNAKGQYSAVFGSSNSVEGNGTFAAGYSNYVYGNYGVGLGQRIISNNNNEVSLGTYNVSNKANTTWGDSGNTLFSVGNGTSTSARHNAFEIRQNGDIYLNDGTNDVKLQDYLQIKVVKLTQSAYDALSPDYDSNTLYVIVN